MDIATSNFTGAYVIMLKVLSYILCDLDPKVKVIGQKAGICDGVPSTSALVFIVVINVDVNSDFFSFLCS